MAEVPWSMLTGVTFYFCFLIVKPLTPILPFIPNLCGSENLEYRFSFLWSNFKHTNLWRTWFHFVAPLLPLFRTLLWCLGFKAKVRFLTVVCFPQIYFLGKHSAFIFTFCYASLQIYTTSNKVNYRIPFWYKETKERLSAHKEFWVKLIAWQL